MRCIQKFITATSLFVITLLFGTMLVPAIAYDPEDPSERLMLKFEGLDEDIYEVEVDMSDSRELFIGEDILSLDVDDAASDFDIKGKVELIITGIENKFEQKPYFTILGVDEQSSLDLVKSLVGSAVAAVWPFIIVLGVVGATAAISALVLLVASLFAKYGFNDFGDFLTDLTASLQALHAAGVVVIDDVIAAVEDLATAFLIKFHHTYSLLTSGASEISLPGIIAILDSSVIDDFAIEINAKSGDQIVASPKYIQVHVLNGGQNSQPQTYPTEPLSEPIFEKETSIENIVSERELLR